MEIFFDKLYRYDRISEPVGVAVPWAKGELKDMSGLAILQDGKPVLIQPKVTSRYEDGSVRFLYVDFLANLPGNKKAKLELVTDYKAEQPESEVALVEEKEDGFFVNLSGMVFAVKNQSQSIFSMVDDSRKIYTEKNFEGPYLKDDEGQYEITLGDWRVVEGGPVKVVLSNKGVNVGCNKRVEFEVRITGYVGKPWIDVSYRIINTTDDPLHIKSLVFYVKPQEESVVTDSLADMNVEMENDSTGCGDAPTDNSKSEGPVFHTRGIGELDMIEEKTPVLNVRTMVGSSNYKTDFYIGRDANEVNKFVDDNFLVKEANEHFAEVLYGTFMADYTDGEDGVCATVYQAQQNYPKAIKAYDGGVAIMLVPEGINKVVMQSGMAKEQRFLLHFHEPSEKLVEIDNRSLIYQMPDKAYIAPEVFKKSGVMLDIFTDNILNDVEILLVNRADDHSRGYGFINWGDSVDPGYTKQGRGGGRIVWSNNEYDYPHSCALLYARTGLRRLYDYMVVTAKHQMDIDICHYSKDPLRIGGQWEHTAGHCNNGLMVCSHEWVEGLIDYYHLTGDERGLEAALGIGDNVMRLLETPMYAKPGEANARETGWALRALVALYVETRDKKWLGKCEWIIDSFKVWEAEYGNWLAPYTDNTAIRVGFMISVAVGSVMRYYREFPREDIKDMLVRAVDDLIENCSLSNGLFYYKELPSLTRNGNNTLLLESLAIAYELTGDKEYLKPGIRTFESEVRRGAQAGVGSKQIIEDTVLVAGGSTKTFAQSFIPLSLYYKALGDAGMTRDLRIC